MKNLKKAISSVALAAMMILAPSLPTFAATTTPSLATVMSSNYKAVYITAPARITINSVFYPLFVGDYGYISASATADTPLGKISVPVYISSTSNNIATVGNMSIKALSPGSSYVSVSSVGTVKYAYVGDTIYVIDIQPTTQSTYFYVKYNPLYAPNQIVK